MAARARRSAADDSATRTALLDAAQALLVEEGYAAVTTRRIAARSGLNNALVHYYFGTMDQLFIELFRRVADRSLEPMASVLDSPQPLWRFWDLSHDFAHNALMTEFIALANHRKAIRAEIAEYSQRLRVLHTEKLAGVLTGYGLDARTWPPAAVVLFLVGMSRFLQMEAEFGVVDGHAEVVAVIEQQIRALEGERGAPLAAPAAHH